MTGLDRIGNALEHISPNDRDTWVKMGMAVKSELGDQGFEIWNDWSQKSQSYNPQDAKTVWNGIAGGKVTAGTLFYEAKQRGWEDIGDYKQATAYVETNRHHCDDDSKRLEKQRKAAHKAKVIWEASTQAMEHPYLLSKGVAATRTLRAIDLKEAKEILGYVPKSSGEVLEGRLLVVPVKVRDALSTLEFIDIDGRKTALAGGKKACGYWATEKLPDNIDKLLIGEGVATVLSAMEATGYPAVAVLSCSNLLAVAKAMRESYPKATLVILADLDKANGEPDHHAVKAAQSVDGLLAVPDFGDNRADEATDFNDMAVQRSKEAVNRSITSASLPEATNALKTAEEVADESAWKNPEGIEQESQSIPYPIDALPQTVRSAVKEVTDYSQAPIAMVASCALAALSLTIQGYADVKRGNRLISPSSLYFLIIAESGERKTSVAKGFFEPIWEFESEQREQHKPTLELHQAAISVWEAKCAGVKDRIKSLSKRGGDSTEQEQQLQRLQFEKPIAPKVPKLTYADFTPEGLASGLHTRWPSGGVICSEAGTVFGSHAMSADSIMRNLSMLNTLWDGEPLDVVRKTSDSFTLQDVRFTALLQVQPETYRKFLEQSGDLARGIGFLARCLFTFPESTRGTRFYKELPETSAHLNLFQEKIKAILNASTQLDGQDGLSPEMLGLSKDAKQKWIECHDEIEAMLAKNGELASIPDIASKGADNIARLACLFHVFEHGIDTEVCCDCMECAENIISWYLSEALQFLGKQTTDLQNLKNLDKWLITYCFDNQKTGIEKTAIMRHCPNKLRKAKELDPLLSTLESLHRVHLTKKDNVTIIQLNPKLLQEVM